MDVNLQDIFYPFSKVIIEQMSAELNMTLLYLRQVWIG